MSKQPQPQGQQQAGIRRLLQAEQKAQELVQKARRDKVAKLKQAKEEAEKEIEAYRAKREAEFAEYAGQFSTSGEDYNKNLEQKTDTEIKELQEAAVSGKEAVIALMLDAVKKVDLDYDEHGKGKY